MQIYKVTNVENDKFYIGKTKKPIEQRFKEHLRDSRNGKTWCVLHDAIRKYGEDKFLIESILTCNDEKTLNTKESDIIEQLQPDYNSAPGGQGGAIRTGLKHSNETKDKIRSKAIGRKASLATREKMKQARLGRKIPREIVDKIARGCAKTYEFTKNGSPITITNLNRYCRENNICRSSMHNLSKGKLKTYKEYGVNRETD